MHTEGVVLGEALVQEQSEPGGVPQGCKAEETMDLIPAELGTHMMVVDTLGSLAEAENLFEGFVHHFCTKCSPYGLVCSLLLRFARDTERAVEHQEPGIRVVQQGCTLQVDSEGCKVACQLEHNLTTSTDWNHPLVGTGRHRIAAASVFDKEVFAAAVAVQWLPVVQFVNAVDKPDTRPSVAASAPISVLFACAAACPVRVPAGGLSPGVVLASLPKTSVLHAPGPPSLEELRI